MLLRRLLVALAVNGDTSYRRDRVPNEVVKMRRMMMEGEAVSLIIQARDQSPM